MEKFEEFLNAGGVVEPNDAMPESYRNAVFRFIE
ncbi:MAG TPA: 1,2-phenylacetyl-CoA epoxidase subunit A, partial [Acidimicrobiaceae bacterium]|nr:1,2-phenylacetyl-CoA epoxidase subunit A [Acidimicrobiaceae bacterium]